MNIMEGLIISQVLFTFVIPAIGVLIYARRQDRELDARSGGTVVVTQEEFRKAA